jgi:hypothetical protein
MLENWVESIRFRFHSSSATFSSLIHVCIFKWNDRMTVHCFRLPCVWSLTVTLLLMQHSSSMAHVQVCISYVRPLFSADHRAITRSKSSIERHRCRTHILFIVHRRCSRRNLFHIRQACSLHLDVRSSPSEFFRDGNEDSSSSWASVNIELVNLRCDFSPPSCWSSVCLSRRL